MPVQIDNKFPEREKFKEEMLKGTRLKAKFPEIVRDNLGKLYDEKGEEARRWINKTLKRLK